MMSRLRIRNWSRKSPRSPRISESKLHILGFLLFLSATAYAQGTPFDTGFQALQNLFTGTVAKVASLIAIVIGGYQFAHGEPGAKRALAGVAAGTGNRGSRDECSDLALGLNARRRSVIRKIS